MALFVAWPGQCFGTLVMLWVGGLEGAGAEWGLLLVLCSWLREIVWLCQPWEGVWFVLLLMPWRREVRGQRDREEGNGWGWQVALKRLTASRQQPWVMLA